MRSLNDLLKKDVIFEWKEVQQHAFDTLKEKFMIAPVLAYPDNDCYYEWYFNRTFFSMDLALFLECILSYHDM